MNGVRWHFSTVSVRDPRMHISFVFHQGRIEFLVRFDWWSVVENSRRGRDGVVDLLHDFDLCVLSIDSSKSEDNNLIS